MTCESEECRDWERIKKKMMGRGEGRGWLLDRLEGSQREKDYSYRLGDREEETWEIWV